MLGVIAGALTDDFARRVAHRRENQRLPDGIGVFGLEDFAAFDLAAQSLGFFVQAIADETFSDFLAGERGFFFKKYREDMFDIFVGDFKSLGPVLLGFGLEL